MLGFFRQAWSARGFSAAVLSLLALSPILLPVAGAFSSGKSMGMACCRTKRQCCCRRSTGTSTKPGITANTCSSDCGRLSAGEAPGAVAVLASAPVRATRIPTIVRPVERDHASASRLIRHSLYQRPPPAA